MSSSVDSSNLPALAVGSRATLGNLQSAPELNGSIAVVVGDTDEATGRVPVKLTGRHAAARPQGIRVKRQNLVAILGPQQAVNLYGFKASDAHLTTRDSQFADKWMQCPVPNLLGVPLVMKQLAPTTTATRPNNENPAVYLMIDPASGYAPHWILRNGLGEVLLARSDGLDFTTTQFWELHDYMCHMISCFSRWAEMSYEHPAEEKKEREAAMTPAAFDKYTKRRQRSNSFDEEEEDEEEEDELDKE